MDGNNWRPAQAEPNMVEASDWRTQLQDDSRQRIVNKIMDILKRHLPVSGPEGQVELKKIAVRFEEKIYTSATSQSDYLRKISLKMLTMETKSQNTGVTNSLAPNPQNPTDPASSVCLWPEELNKGGSRTQLQSSQQSLMQIPSNLQSTQSTPQQTQPSMMQAASHSGFQQNQQRLLGQQNSLSNMQQQQQQQLLGQENNISNLNQQQLGSQIGVGLQQQQLIGAQSGVSNMQSSLHLLSHQAKVGGLQQTAQGSSTMMQIPGQQSQSQPLQQQLMPQLQSLPAQFQQQLGLQHQSNPLQRDMQQRLNSSGIPPQNVIEQKQIQSQRMLPEASSTSIDSTSQTGHANTADWQEEAYQKIKAMKEMYLPDLNEMYQMVLLKFQQHDSLAQLPKEQIERLEMMKVFLERAIAFLQASKSNIPAGHGDKMGSYEEQIVNFLRSHRG